MARMARGEYLDPRTVQIVHVVQRCVRRAFLCGNDPLTGDCHEHRRQWIRDRLEFLASVFGIDCLTYAVMSNHLHVVLRSRPDVVRQWSDEEVARRWMRLFPKRSSRDRSPAEPTEPELSSILNDPKKLADLRLRLSDISWWMRCTAEVIARQANKEDGCTGRFWQGRYKAQPILDEASLLACSIYVDLNPIRAAMAPTPEHSQFTGAFDRISDLIIGSRRTKPVAQKNQRSNRVRRLTKTWERSRRRVRSGWMSPLQIDERADAVGHDPSRSGRRASRKGFLSITLTRYLELLDWTGRQLRSDKYGSIPSHLAPILERLGIDTGSWCELVRHFGRLFKRVAGQPASISHETTRRGQNFMQAPGSRFLQSG